MTVRIKMHKDQNLILAGESFMYLRWVESAMIDFLTLEAGGSEMRDNYNRTYGHGDWAVDFAKNRLERSEKSFGTVKEDFLEKWPCWKNDPEVHGAIERAGIFRNAIGHAQVQLRRPYLLYMPKSKGGEEWNILSQYLSCLTCHKPIKDCFCKGDDTAFPRSLKFTFQPGHNDIVDILYTLDRKCFLPTSKLLNVAYWGLEWLSTSDGFEWPRNDPN